eukprot:TRINITY_DN3617_c0_g1_i2.p1 TRINITY_DN3617_c0_g1~~TRINITY_DN3617_c0_g1_i2.p1  ORF type:complete len:1219 (-),score=307.46 TRINITY_DN3617_c0_g1_i2:12-3668(-)
MSKNIEWLELFTENPGRVKAIAFHPKRTWVLISLHDGVAQIWDYRLKTLVDSFDEHDGPIRGVDFHHSQPLFVTCSDDYNIKVWNYRERRCLFTLYGHTDYVRSVQFHPEHPWIISASDDQTIKIWNWQSRKCISTLAGHSHYVMSARFHPTKDLVVSASLDLTVRVWDISGLQGKKGPTSKFDEQALKIQNDLFGSTDVLVKYVLEGHSRGVNWADFHPDQPLIISGADDREIKIWRMGNNSVSEYDVLRGHYNNICAVGFHRNDDIAISVAEDRTVRIWDTKKRTQLYSHRIDKSRCWSYASHPNLNIFAVGHDDGFIVFKLEHERPPHCLESEDGLFYIKDRYLRVYDFNSRNDSPLLNITAKDSGAIPRKVHYYPGGNSVLVTYNGEINSWYRLFTLPKDGRQIDVSDSIKATGHAVAWLRRDRFAVLVNNQLIAVKDLTNNTKYSIQTPFSIDYIYAAPMERLVLKSEDRVCLFDITQNAIIAIEKISNIRDVIWSGNSSDAWVAFICDKKVVVADGRLKNINFVSEPTKVKTGVWDSNGVFIYNTLTHIKYFLRNGDKGIIRTVDRPIYITAVKGDQLFCLDRKGINRIVTVEINEFMFKRALDKKDFGEVMRIVENSGLIGQAIIGYLEQRGYPDIALRFATDDETRFDLAIQCGTPAALDIAFEAATNLENPDTWGRLGVEALRQGNIELVVKAYRQTLAFEKLSTLYSLLGNNKKLNQMLAIATEKRGDHNARFQNSLLLGDVQERVKILAQVGQFELAYMTAINHGLEEDAAKLYQLLQLQKAERLGINIDTEPLPEVNVPSANPNAKLLFPPVPINLVKSENWPLTRVKQNRFEIPKKARKAEKEGGIHSVIDVEEGNWDNEDLKLSGDSDDSNDSLDLGPETGGWDDIDVDLSGSDDDTKQTETVIPLPKKGTETIDLWTRKSNIVYDHIAAGSFESAMQLLNDEFGVVNFEPMRELFLSIYRSSSGAFLGHPGCVALPYYLNRNIKDRSGRHQPSLTITFQDLIEKLRSAYSLVSEGKFSGALELFSQILTSLPVVNVSNTERVEFEEMINICREYILGLSLELEKRSTESVERQLELAIYFSYCDLQTGHQKLALKQAMKLCANEKNYGMAYTLASKLMEFTLSKQDEQLAQKVLGHCEKKERSDSLEVDFDERNPFVICAGTKKPIYQGTPTAQCRFCKSKFITAWKGKICNICNISSIEGDE